MIKKFTSECIFLFGGMIVSLFEKEIRLCCRVHNGA